MTILGTRYFRPHSAGSAGDVYVPSRSAPAVR